MFAASLVLSFALNITYHEWCHGFRLIVQLLLIKGMLHVWELSIFDGTTFLGRVVCSLRVVKIGP